jgi:hypothetical protein
MLMQWEDTNYFGITVTLKTYYLIKYEFVPLDVH